MADYRANLSETPPLSRGGGRKAGGVLVKTAKIAMSLRITPGGTSQKPPKPQCPPRFPRGDKPKTAKTSMSPKVPPGGQAENCQKRQDPSPLRGALLIRGTVR